MRTALFASAVAVACLFSSMDAAAAPKRSRVVLNVPASSTVPAGQDAARDFLVARAAVPAHVALVAGRTFSLTNTKIYRFHQMHMGVPVYARGAGIALDGQGHVIVATAEVEDQLPSSVTPAIGADQAASIVVDRTGMPAEARNAQLVVVPMPGRARLAWMVQAPPLPPNMYSPLVTIDALDGRVLAVVDATRYVNNANVFTINPVEDNETTTTVQLPISAPNTTTQNADIVSYNCVDNGTIKLSKSNHGGWRATHICDLMQAQPDTNGDFVQYDRGLDDEWGDHFSALQAFYHANKAYAYYRSFEGNSDFQLGATDIPLFTISNWLTTPRGVRLDAGADADLLEAGTFDAAGIDAGALSAYQNAAYAAYTPGSTFGFFGYYADQITGGTIQLGQGLHADYSYDGQVVYHEFTHAVVASTANFVPYWHLDSQGATMAPGSLNEGIADFFSASISDRAKMGTYATRDNQTLGKYPECIRDLGIPALCVKDMAGEVHQDGMLLANVLWQVRDTLPTADAKKKFSQTVFTVLAATTNGDMGFEDFAQAIVTALVASMDAATSKALEDAFTTSGLLPVCNRTVLWAGKPIRGTSANLAYTFSIGGTMEFNTVPAITYAPSIFQVQVPVNPGATEITATFRAATTSSWGGGGFDPWFLVNYKEPIAFDLGLGFQANTTTLVDATSPTEGSDAGSSGTLVTWTATIPVEPGATNAYVMLVNKGEMGALYMDVTFKVMGGETDADLSDVVPQDDAPAEAAPGEDAGADASPPATGTPATNEDDGGCGCRTVPVSSGSGASLALLAAAALLARRRKN